LGVTRTLVAAYNQHRGAIKGQKKQLPGSWRRDYDRYDWKARAEAWDRRALADDPASTSAATLQGVEPAALAMLGRVRESKSQPNSWAEQMKGLEMLMRFVPPAVFGGILSRPGSGPKPAEGPSGFCRNG
jgi:hypothetical protein